MENFNLCFEYEIGGKRYADAALENAHYKIEYSINARKIETSIAPKAALSPVKFEISFKRNFLDGDAFYANGYQAWTTSREYGAQDVEAGVTKLADIHPKLKALAASSGDYLFTEYKKIPGIFHGYTYAYFKRGAKIDLFGSLCEKNGFTVFKCNFKSGTFTIAKDIEGITIDKPYNVFDIVKISGGYDDVFDEYFSLWDINPRLKGLAGYTSWYNYFQKIDEEIILRDLEGLKKVKDKANIFQIDDGYETFVGDWLDENPKKFPNGMGHIADKIHEAGFLAGLWLAPLNAQKKSRTAREHPDWLIKDNKTGKPIVGVAAWGGAYGLDIYNAEVREYLKGVFRAVFGEWGFDMVKLDFLYSQCMQPRNGKTRGEIMCDAMEFLRECAGGKLILGCGVPLGAAFGYVDACRTGCDVDLSYREKIYNTIRVNSEIISTQNSINNTIFRRHLNGRAFCGDPDVFFLRDKNLKFSENQKLLLARINNLFGGVLFVSDDVGGYDENRLALLDRLFTKTDIKVISADYVSKDDIKIVFTEDKKEKTLEFNLKTGALKNAESPLTI
ncbi:MAG: alpha-galactosidase [Clostridiales bacterium]|jgi:alpha-galactosidase|nr:alpha-galactosidase [Clostridiales bacterium]